MSGQKNIFITTGFVLSISLITAALTGMLSLQYYSQLQFNQLNAICGLKFYQISYQVDSNKELQTPVL